MPPRPRWASLLAALILSTPLAAMCGDCNLDSAVDMVDTLLVAHQAAGIQQLRGRQLCLGDAQGDGDVDILDALVIAMDLAGLGTGLACRCDPDWRLVATTGAPARWGHTLSFDSFGGAMVTFAGEDGSGRRDDVWKWYGVDWSPKPTGLKPTPPQRAGAGLRRVLRVDLHVRRPVHGRLWRFVDLARRFLGAGSTAGESSTASRACDGLSGDDGDDLALRRS